MTESLATMIVWETRHLCLACQMTLASRQPDLCIVELTVASARHITPRCQSCQRAAGDLSLATGRIYVYGVGSERPATDHENDVYTRLVARLSSACMRRHETHFRLAVDLILDVFVPGGKNGTGDLDPTHRYQLLPAATKELIDIGSAMFDRERI